MSGVNIPQNDNSDTSITGMASQLGINVAIAVAVLMVFTILRPNNSLVYAPKYKYSNKTKKPPTIGPGLFAWFKIIRNTPDEVLLEKIGYDAVLFIAFIRMLRQLLMIMTLVGVVLLIPLNILANRFTGPWPPELSVDVLSFATINTTKDTSQINLLWYWIHCLGTWGFSLLIYFHLWFHYHKYIRFRQHYFASPEYQRSTHARTLIIFNVPSSMQSDEALANWVQSMNLKYPVEQVSIGRRNNTLARCVEEHEDAVRKLEILLSQYLKHEETISNDGDTKTTAPKATTKKRPMVRLGGFMGCCGGRKVDAIDHYTERVRSLREQINEIRSNFATNKPTNYGWISFANVAWAHSTAKHLSSPAASHLLRLPERLLKGEPPHHQHPRVELAPQPKDILWNNLSLNEHVRRSKRIIITVLYYAFVFFWFIPSSFLSASSNVKEFIKLFPNANTFLHQHKTFVALLSSWFTPLVMAIFFLILPKIMRLLSKHQGYLTTTSLDRQVFAKLYTFFLINNLLVFTVTSTLMKLYAQIKSAAQGNEVLTAERFFATMGENLVLVAKNLSDVSTFWLSYVTLKGLGVIIDLAQLFVLLSITLTKLFTKPSPRQLQEMTRPSQFDYPVFYNLLIFFFTIGLLYSVISPLVLPFAMFYFMLATMVFKYLLMYVFVTGVETGGQIWRILFNRMLVSILLFQVVMIGILKLKDADGPAYSCVPLPIFTALFKLYCIRRLDRHAYYYKPDFVDDMSWFDQRALPALTKSASASSFSSSLFSTATTDNKTTSNASLQSTPSERRAHHLQQSIGQRFGDPAFFAELPIPMVHDNVRHLLPGLYGTQSETQQKTVTSKLTRQKSVRHLSMIQLPGQGMPFQSIKEDELENDDSTEGVKGYYKFDEDHDHYSEADDLDNSNGNSNEGSHSSTSTPPPTMPSRSESAPLYYTPLSTLPQSQLSSKRKSRLGTLLRDTSASLLTTGRSSQKVDPYSATRPLMMGDDHLLYANQPMLPPNDSTSTVNSTAAAASFHAYAQSPPHQHNFYNTRTQQQEIQQVQQQSPHGPSDVIEMAPFDQEQSLNFDQGAQQQQPHHQTSNITTAFNNTIN